MPLQRCCSSRRLQRFYCADAFPTFLLCGCFPNAIQYKRCCVFPHFKQGLGLGLLCASSALSNHAARLMSVTNKCATAFDAVRLSRLRHATLTHSRLSYFPQLCHWRFLKEIFKNCQPLSTPISSKIACCSSTIVFARTVGVFQFDDDLVKALIIGSRGYSRSTFSSSQEQLYFN
jgi:hypothetical protein